MIGHQIRAARLACKLGLGTLAGRVPISPGYLSQIEHGTRRPSAAVVARLSSVLGTDLVLPGPVLEPEPEVPDRVSRDTVQALTHVLAGQRRLEDAIGSVPLLVPTVAQLQVVKGLVRGARGPLRRELLNVGAQWATFTGWLCTATGRHNEAGRAFATAADWAGEARDETLTSHIYAFRGYAAGKVGDLAAMEGLASTAHRFRRIHPAQQAYNSFQHARVLARLGDRRQAVRLLDQAVRQADAAGRGGDPPAYGYWYSPAFFRLNVGLTHAWLGNHHEAAALITDGLAELPGDQRHAEWIGDFRVALAA